MYTPPVTSLQVTVPGLQGSRPSLFDLRLNDNVGALFGPSGTVFDGWCLAMNTFLDVNTASTGTVYSSYETGTLSIAGLPIGVGPSGLANLDSINWLINEYNGTNYTWGEIQATIWNLLGFDWTLFSNALGNPSPATVAALSGQALANDGFLPDVGQTLGVVLDVFGGGVQQQTTLIETKAAKLGDRVWEDTNANGIQDPGENGISGAVVRLVRDINQDGDFNDANELIQTTTTDALGNYNFKGLAPSLEYQVQFTTPTGYNAVSPRQVGAGTPGTDSDGLVSDKIVLSAGEYNQTIDSGFYKFASLGDRVWIDANGNGQQDFGEGGQAGVVVNLINSAGTNIGSQTTGVGGAYLFNNLVPGSYTVEFIAPAGQGFTVANQGPDISDSDADPTTGRTGIITLVSGQNDSTVDAGLVAKAPPPTGSLSGTVLEDRDNNGTGDTPIAGVTVVLKRPDGSVVGQTTTAADGTYSFTSLTPGTYTVEQTNLPGYRDVGDKDGGNPNSITAIVPVGGSSTGNDFVDDRPASIGDRVWFDDNRNGQLDGTEAGVQFVTVNLLDAAGNVVNTQTTDSNGRYLFSNLDPGTYSVQFIKPPGLEFSPANQGPDATDSDADPTTGRTGPYTLVSGQSELTVDAGLILPAPQPGSVSGTVLEDLNNDGTGDTPIPGVTVVLKRPDGSVVGQTTTDAGGNYNFPNVPAGNYTVHETNLPGYNDVGDKDGGNPNSITVTVPAGGSSPDNNFVDDRPASLGDRVWLDADGDGQQEPGDQNVPGVVVNLLNAAGNVVSTQTTDGNGQYLFTNLDAGTYSVQFVKPTGYDFTVANQGPDATDSDADQTTGRTGTYTLVSGQSNTTVDAGLKIPAPQPGSVSGTVLEDLNNDGLGDSPIAGVTVVLKRPDGSVAGQTTTDASGNYNFPNVPAGNYTVHETNLPGYNDVGDKDGGNPNSIAVTVPAGGSSPGNNFVDDRPASLGDRVWLDADGDGQQEPGDQNVPGVVVNLLNAAGNVVSTQTTDGNGQYLFTNLDAGTYSVQFVKPTGFDFTVANQGPDATDSDADPTTGRTGTYTLVSGQNERTVDAGLKIPAPQPGSVSGTVLEDLNNDGTGDTPIPGVTVVLKNPAGVVVGQTTTDASGNYNFPNVPAGNYTVHETNLPGYNDVGDKDGGNPNSIAVTVPAGGSSPDNNFVDDRPASLGDRVWLDADGDGQQEPGDQNVPGVVVNLLNAAGNVVSTQTTDGNGQYLFTNLDAGTYSVQFVKPTGYDFTVANQGPDATDSDADQTTGRTGTYTLVSGQSNTTVDAGLKIPAPQPGSVSGTVLEDLNNDGLGDSPIAGVTVVLKRPDGSVAGQTTTDASGNYNFPNVPAGNYTVHETNLPGYNDVGDKDGGNPNSIAVTVPAGGSSPGNNFVDDRPASLGDRVWLDADGDGQQEPGDQNVPGVVVNLLNAAGNVVSTQTTDGNGQYLFTNLDAGTYSVQFVKPTGFDFTVANQGPDATDSDADPTTGRTGTYTLVSGQNERTVDAGLKIPAPQPGSVSGTVLEDLNNDGTGDTPIPGVTVVLKNPAGVVVGQTTTDASGNYNFPNVPAGNYTVHETNLPGYNDVGDKDGGNPNSIAVTVPAGGSSPGNNFVDDRPASLGDRVWLDADGDGQQEPGDQNVPGVVVNLLNAAGNVVSTQTTDGNGQYLFTNLDAGTYSVQFVKPTGYDFTVANQGPDATDSDADQTTGRTGTYTLVSGQNERTVDAGLKIPAPKPGSVSGTVLEDLNNDGLGDSPIAGVTVVLKRPDGSVVGQTTTDAGGNYNFPNVPAGNYTVHETNLPGYNDVGDKDGGNPNSIAVTVPAGGSSPDNNFVDDRPASLGDRVWLDADGDGQQEPGDQNVPGVVVNLLNAAGNVVSTQTTDGNGQYLFTNLDAGTYSVQFVKPTGYDFTVANQGPDATDSDADQTTGRTGTYTLVSGQSNTTVDAGLKIPAPKPGSVSGTVLEDLNNDGLGDSPIAGVTVVLKRPDGSVVGQTTTDAGGNYNFPNVPAGNYTVHETNLPGYNDVGDKDGGNPNSIAVTVPAGGSSPDNNFVDDRPASLGDRVWLDADGDGQQEPGDQNVPGVVVNLLNAAGNVVSTQTTDGNGQYLFTNLDAGTYSVQFVKPTGYDFTVANQGPDATDSDADQTTGRTGTYTLVSGQNERTVDAGLKIPAPKPGSVSGTVLEDLNNDGLGDSPIAGVTVVLKRPDGSVVGQTTTDAGGNYNFPNVPAGNYTVHETNLPGYNDVGDKDGGNPNSIAVTVPAGGSSPDNNFVDDRPASLGDRVWLDADGDGQQEPGDQNVPGVVVNLLNAAGNVVSTQTTDGNGQYLFTNLDAGTYSVQFVKPTGYDFTVANQGPDATDSDADQTTGRTGTYTLVSGQSNTTVDAGLKIPAPKPGSVSGTVLEDLNNDGLGDSPIAGVTVVLKRPDGSVAGQTTTDASGNYNFPNVPAGNYTVHETNLPGYNDVSDKDGGNPNSIAVTVPAGGSSPGNNFVDDRPASLGDLVYRDTNGNGQQDPGELGVSGVTVRLLNAAGNVVSTQTTNGAGNYLFTGLDAGTYSVEFVKPAGFDFTTANVGNDATDSDANPTTGRTGTYTLVSGQTNTTVDAGLVEPAKPGVVKGTVLEDRDNNGTGDVPIAGVTVVLKNPAGQVVLTTMTAADGTYTFNNVPAGNYTVEQTNLPGYNDVSDKDGGNPNSIAVNVPAGGQSIGNNFIDDRPAALGDRVYFDTNGNGQQDAGEVGVGGVTVKLLNAAGAVVSTQTTNDKGDYLFTGLDAGSYSVEFVKPAGLNFTTANVGNDATDSDANQTTGRTGTYTLVSGQTDRSVDAGLVKAPVVPDCVDVTYDFSGNSANDGPDGNSRSWTNAATGVTVTARAFSQTKGSSTFEAAYLGSYSGGLGVTDITEGDGRSNNTHTIDNVGKNNYVVFQFSTAVEVDKAVLGLVVGDSDFQFWVANSSSTLTSLNSSVLHSASFTAVNTTTLTGPRTADINPSEVRGNIFIIAADTTDTTPNDFFKLEKLQVCVPVTTPPPPQPVLKGSIGNLVFEDKNYNGVQDAGEVGIKGVTVKLLNSAGAVVSTTTTDNSGNYVFNGLNAGSYKVQVTPTSGYLVTKQDQGGNDDRDSDINAAGLTGTINLAAGQNITNVDAGLYRKASIGDKVFADWDHDGYQDAGEGVIRGVKVMLQNSAGVTIATTTTDNQGMYKFVDIDPGSYRVGFDKTNGVHVADNVSVRNWQWAKVNVGSDDTRDSDATAAVNAVAYTPYTTLDSGEYDNTWDVGITPIVIDLNGDGIQTISRSNAGGSFDLFGNGHAVKSGWVSSSDGFLAVDLDGNGKIESSAELFGGTSKGAGYAKLSSYDSNGDGHVDMLDTDFAKLLIWQDSNGNHQTDDGELMTLAQAGVTSLSLNLTAQNFYVDSQGNVHGETSSATLASGQQVTMTDVYFSVDKSDAVAAGAALPTIGELLGTGEHEITQLVGDSGNCRASQQMEDSSCAEAGELLRKLSAMSRAELEQHANLAA